MINRKPLKFFQSFAGGKLFKPLYENYSFANIVPTISYLLTGKQTGPLLAVDCFGRGYPTPRKIVLIIIDAFGFSAWERAQKKVKALDRITGGARVTPISALFPSTTAAAITTLNTGVLPSRHALFEWFLYLKEYGEIIQSLPFSTIGKNSYQDDLAAKGFSPENLINRSETTFQKLNSAGVPSFTFVPKSYINSSYNRIAQVGSRPYAFRTLAEGLVNLKNLLKTTQVKSYFNFYWDKVDSISHQYGPDSDQSAAEAASFWQTFDYVFSDYKKDPETLFIFSADHGQIKTNPGEAIYLNREVPRIDRCLKVTPAGKPIYSTGYCRDVFLHVREDKLQYLLDLLQRILQGKALVIRTKTALAEGLFGPPPYSLTFLNRLGNLLILPYAGQTVWWYEKDVMEVKFIGSHGGLSPEEMISVLAVA